MATEKQLALLRMTASDGLLEVSGVDGRKVHGSTLRSCVERGWLVRDARYQTWAGPYNQPTAYSLTDSGAAQIKEPTK